MISAGDVDRLFLQAVLSRGSMSTELAQMLWAKSVQAVNDSNDALNIQHDDSKDSWDDFVARINRSIDKLDFEFRALHDEVSGREMYALVNTKGDEIAQLATDYTPTEIAFFKGVVEQIMLAPHEAYSVSSLAALREINELKLSMTKSQGEVILASFVAKGWLLKSKLGRYSLSTRALLELLPYLKSTYPDEMLECTVCMETLTRGVACYTPNCKVRLHLHCFSKYRRTNSSCPSCTKDWPREAKDKPLKPVGEGAAREGDERRRRVQTQDSSDDEEEQGEEPSQETPKKKNGRQQTKKNVKFDESMAVDDEEDEEESSPSQTQTQTQGSQRPRRSTRH